MSSSPATESLILPDAPPIPDLRFRHWQEADLEDMVRIFNAVADADQFDIKVTLDEIKTWYVPRPDFDPQRDIIVAHVADEMIAFCECGWYDNTDEIRFYSITGRVHPNWRRRGVGTALIRYNQQHARELAQTHPYDMPKKFVSYGTDTAIGTQTILTKEGFTPARYFTIWCVIWRNISLMSLCPQGLRCAQLVLISIVKFGMHLLKPCVTIGMHGNQLRKIISNG